MIRRTFLAGLALQLTVTSGTSVLAASPTADEAEIDLKERRDRCESLAANIRRHYKPETDVYKTAARLYEAARIKTNAYVDQLAEMIKRGQSGDLSAKAKEVVEAVNAFAVFAEDKVKEMGAWTWIPLVIQGLVDGGIAIFKAVAERNDQIRGMHAKNLLEKASWREWNKVS